MGENLDVLVTGGAGFIGSHVVDRLLAAGHRPRIYDLRRSAHHSPAAVAAVRGDIHDLPRLSRAMRGFDVVIHLAATADVARVQAAPAESEERNAHGTLNVLEAACRSGVGRLLYASTIWVYSDTERDLLDESVPLRPPAHLYSATKLAGELYCHSYQELYGLDCTILRFGIPYGPRARPSAVVPAFVARALAGEPLTVAGDGLQSRRFVYVEDLAEGVVSALAPVAANRVYNLVGSEEITVAEVAETVRDLVGGVEIIRVPGRAADFGGAPVSGARAQQELGWSPTTPFREGVRCYVEWLLAQPAHDEPSWLPAAATLARRGAIAALMAALVSATVLGLALMVPIDGDMDRLDTFAAMLGLLLPPVLATAFEWDAQRGRLLRAVCWTWALAALAPVVVPWPHALDRLGHDHPYLLSMLALSGGLAAIAIDSAPRLRALLPAAGDR